MSIEQNKAIARHWMDEIWQNASEAVIDELLADNFVFNYASSGTNPDKKGYKQAVKRFHTRFPDVQLTTEDVVAEGDKVAVYWKGSATHKGKFWGIALRDKRVTMAGISIIQIFNGKILREVGYDDRLGLLQQIGAFPSSG